MKICFLGCFTAGGTEKACFKLVNRLVKYMKVFVISTAARDKTFYLDPEVQFYKLNRKSIFQRNIELYNFLKKNKIDILITLEAMTGIISLIPAFFSPCKHFIWEHANYYQRQGSKYIQIIRQLELLFVDRYILLTDRDINNFRKNFIVKAHLERIYNIAEPQSEQLYNLQSKTIICVGHIRKIKNFIVIPDIAQIVLKKHPDWCWKIYGDTVGDEYEKIVAKIKKYKLEEKLIFCGRVNDMGKEYKKASIFVLTSFMEGLPMVLLEAKTNKLPLVSFDIETGPSEIIADGINGFLIEPYDVKIMADKIAELIERPNLRSEFSKNSIIGLDEFSDEKIVKQWLEILN